MDNPYNAILVKGKVRRDFALTSVLALVLVTVCYWMHTAFLDAFAELTKEDGLLENASVAFYVLAGAICLRRVRSASGVPRLWLVAFAALSFLLAGEEISWGQRQFDYEIEELQKVNVQGETNLHNLPGFNAPRLLSLGSLFLGLALPLAVSLHAGLRKLVVEMLSMPLPHPGACITFLLSYAWYAAAHSSSAVPISVEESRECLIALAVLQYASLMSWVTPYDRVHRGGESRAP